MHNSRGQSLVQLLLVIALTSIAMPALITGFVTSRSGRAQQEQRLQATTHIREMQEAVRAVRDEGWNSFTSGNVYHPQIVNDQWVLASGAESVGGFTRQIEVFDVLRGDGGNIVSSEGELDPSTKRLTLTVAWNMPYSSFTESILYLTRHDNDIHVETTEEQFNLGTADGVTITNEQGGEVILGGGGQGSWCAPNLSIQALDLPKNGVANAISAVEGRAYVGTGENASGVSFANVGINNTNPPTAQVEGTYDCCKTNDIYGVGNTTYIATDTNAKEIVILDIAATPYTEIGYFDAPGPQDGGSVYVVGSVGYMTQDSGTFHTFDLSSNSGSRPQLGNVSLAGNGRDLQVVGNYAYVAIDSTSTQLQIIDISNPSSPVIVASSGVGNSGGRAIFVNETGTRAYLATAASATGPEVYIIDLTVPGVTKPVVGSYETGGMSPTGINVVTNNKLIVVGTGGTEYQVVDIVDETAPFACGGLNIDSGVRGISSVLEADGDAYSYIITGDQSAEFKIIEGGPGAFSSSGTYESATFDAGDETAFNRLMASISQPTQTSIRLQIAVADAINDSCEGVDFTFVGPDKSESSYYISEDGQSIAGLIPFDNDGVGFENPGRCMRYRAYLSTSDSTQTPVLYEMTVNYAP